MPIIQPTPYPNRDDPNTVYCYSCSDPLFKADALIGDDGPLCPDCYDEAMFPIFDAIMEERAAQDAKWGQQNHNDPDYFCIFSEEVGEIAKAIVEHQPTETLQDELIQAAAVIVQWIQAIDRRP